MPKFMHRKRAGCVPSACASTWLAWAAKNAAPAPVRGASGPDFVNIRRLRQVSHYSRGVKVGRLCIGLTLPKDRAGSGLFLFRPSSDSGRPLARFASRRGLRPGRPMGDSPCCLKYPGGGRRGRLGVGSLFGRFVMCGSVRVISVRGFVGDRGLVCYVGRECCGWPGSVLGNQFVIGRHGDRSSVIQQYKAWLWGELCRGGQVRDEVFRLVELVRGGHDLLLGCWCHPLECHGDVVRDCVLWLVGGGVLPG